MLMAAGWQHDSFGPPGAGRLAGAVGRQDAEASLYQGLPPLGDLLPLDTQLLSPSLARAFNVPTPLYCARPDAQTAQQSGTYGLPGNSSNAFHLTGPSQVAQSEPAPGRSSQFPTIYPTQDPFATAGFATRAGTFGGGLVDSSNPQHFQQQYQHLQQQAGNAGRGGSLLGAFDPTRGIDQERMQQLASQYANVAAGYNAGGAMQPSLRSPAAAFQPLGIHAAQAAMYNLHDASAEAQAAVLAQHAGASGYQASQLMASAAHMAANAANPVANHGRSGSGQGSQGVGDKRPAAGAAQAGHSGLHSGNGSDDAGLDERGARALKRPRLVWTPQLHQRFVDAVNQLGLKNAVPKTIMQLMSVDGLTRENVASHLQKYRLQLKRQPGDGSEDQGLEGGPEGPARMDSQYGLGSLDEDGRAEGAGSQKGSGLPYGNPESSLSQHMAQMQGRMDASHLQHDAPS